MSKVAILNQRARKWMNDNAGTLYLGPGRSVVIPGGVPLRHGGEGAILRIDRHLGVWWMDATQDRCEQYGVGPDRVFAPSAPPSTPPAPPQGDAGDSEGGAG